MSICCFWNYIILISVHHLSCVLFLLHSVNSDRNVVIQWIKYILCLIFMPFIHWHLLQYTDITLFRCFNLSHSIHLCVFYLVRCSSFVGYVYAVCFFFFVLFFVLFWFWFGLRQSIAFFHWCGKQYTWYGICLFSDFSWTKFCLMAEQRSWNSLHLPMLWQSDKKDQSLIDFGGDD